MSDDGGRSATTPMRFAYQELGTWSMAGVVAGISCGLMAIVVLLGPMSTLHTLTLVQRLAYFGLITVVHVPICFGFGFFTLYVTRSRTVVYVTAALAVTCSILVAPGATFTIVLYAAFHEGSYPQATFIAIYAFGMLITCVGTGMSFYVLYTRVTRTFYRSSTPENASEDSADATPVDSPPEAATPELRLPEDMGRDIVYVHVSGHYVEVVTTGGSAVVLMSLSEVVRALKGDGMQTHRSYWAAYRHIDRLESTDRRFVLHLTGGHQVPVSRSFRDSVQAFVTACRTGE